MKKIFTLTFSLILGFTLFAQVPQGINFQAVARNDDGDPLANTNVTVKFRILQGSANGSPVFTETHSQIQTDDCGMFTRTIGNANRTDFEQIDWSTGSKWLEVTINNVEIATTEMLSVPYALYSGKSKTTWFQAFQPEIVNITDTERNVYKEVSPVDVPVLESGTYLILANLGGSATSGDSGLSGSVRKLVSGGTSEIFDFRVQGKPNGQIWEQFESSGWGIANLNAGDFVRLYYHQGSWVTPPDSSPYKVNRGKLMIFKLD